MDTPPPPPAAAPRSNLPGILWMAAAAAVVSVMHVLVRHTTQTIDASQVALVRNIVCFVAMLPWLLRQERADWVPRRPGLMLFRGLVGTGAMLTWFYALSLIPAGDATAISFTVVIFATAFAALILKEKVGVRRWSAVAVGFVGAIVIIRPGLGGIGADGLAGALLALVSSLLWALALIMIKVLSRWDSPVTIVFYTNLIFAVVTLVPGLLAWTWPTAELWAVLVLIGVMAAVGHSMMAQAMRAAEASAVMPVDFTRLIWASAVGFVMFGEFPDGWTWAGAGLICAAAGYIGYREARLRSGSGSGGPPPAGPTSPGTVGGR